jgi:hypothetical protein
MMSSGTARTYAAQPPAAVPDCRRLRPEQAAAGSLASVPDESVPADLPARLRAGLTAALRTRDKTAAAVLRTALAAIGNAEAVPAAGRFC